MVEADFGEHIGYAEVRANGSYATRETADDIEAGILTPGAVGSSLGEATDAVILRSRLAAMALDVAGWDALGKMEGLPLHSLLRGESVRELATHAQIGFGDIDGAIDDARRFMDEGFGRLKVRVGAADEESDLERLRAVRGVVGSSVSLVADANGGWSLAQALGVLPALRELDIEWLEQPVAEASELATVTARGQVRIRADESARDTAAVAGLARAHAVDGVHLKLEKSGTVSRLIDAIDVAVDAGLSVAFGQMDQGRLGCAATAQIAAGLDIDEAELWGCADVVDDVAGPLTIRRGAVQIPQEPGLGVHVALSTEPRGRL